MKKNLLEMDFFFHLNIFKVLKRRLNVILELTKQMTSIFTKNRVLYYPGQNIIL